MSARTGKAKIVILIATIILIGLAGAYAYRNRATYSRPNEPFPTIGLKLLQSTNRSYVGDTVCDSRINEPALNPDDCVAALTLDAGLTGTSPTFTGAVRVKNLRPELANLKPHQVRCFKDAYAADCTLVKTREEGDVTTYRFAGRNALNNELGYVPIGIEIKLDESFHVAAIDWLKAYNPNGFSHRTWGGSYRAVMVPLNIEGNVASPERIQATERIVKTAVERLNREAQRFGQPPTFALTSFERRPTCSIDRARYLSTIGGLESSCGIEAARAEWYSTTFTFLVSPEETCPRFWVVEKPGDEPPNIPATYGFGGVICVSTHPNYPEEAIVSNLFHEFIHAFGAADHYGWRYGKDPTYTCNVAQDTTICPVAAEEIGWR